MLLFSVVIYEVSLLYFLAHDLAACVYMFVSVLNGDECRGIGI